MLLLCDSTGVLAFSWSCWEVLLRLAFPEDKAAGEAEAEEEPAPVLDARPGTALEERCVTVWVCPCVCLVVFRGCGLSRRVVGGVEGVGECIASVKAASTSACGFYLE